MAVASTDPTSNPLSVQSPRQDEIVESRCARGEPVLGRARQGQRVALGWVGVGAEVLSRIAGRVVDSVRCDEETTIGSRCMTSDHARLWVGFEPAIGTVT